MTADGEASTMIGALPSAERRIEPLASSTTAFVGFAPAGPLDRAVHVDSFDRFAAEFSDRDHPRAGPFLGGAKLAHAVRGFFRNGGRACWVVRVQDTDGHLTALRLLAELDEPMIIAVPDVHALPSAAASTRVQTELIATCERVVGRVALLDTPPGLDPEEALAWRSQLHVDSPAGAAYYPWIEVPDPTTGGSTQVPPSGHVAGLLARVDSNLGTFRAPTAEALLATDGPLSGLTSAEQHRLNRAGVNCLRAWPGPEVRVWGAATLSSDSELRYLHRQRTVGHLAASIAEATRWAADEPNDARVRAQVCATVTSFLAAAWRDGALEGHTQTQAFYVRCDEELNDEHACALGDLVLEIGLAVRRSGDFRVLRISHRAAAA